MKSIVPVRVGTSDHNHEHDFSITIWLKWVGTKAK